MPSNKQPTNELLKPAEDMGFGLDLRKISKWQSSSKTAKESSQLPQSNRSSKAVDKLKSKSGVGPQCSDLKQKAKQVAVGKIQNQESVKRSAIERDELVKHMSNLPGYLLHTDKGEKFQEKAFNVGVLDWSQLEKWKHKHKHIPVPASSFTSFNSTESSSRTATKSSISVGIKEKFDDKKGLLSSSSMSSYRECRPESTKYPFQNVKRFESSKSETKNIGDAQRMTLSAFEPLGKTRPDRLLEKERRNGYSKRTSRVGSFASNLRHPGISEVPNENANGRDDGDKQNMEALQEYNHNKKERKHKYNYDMGQPSVKSKNEGVSFNSKKMSSSSNETMDKLDKTRKSDFDIVRKHCNSEPTIMLLRPQEILSSSSSEDQLSELRASSDGNFSESSQSSLSLVSLPEEVCYEDVCSEIPHSCPLSSGTMLTSSKTLRHSISTDLDINYSSAVAEIPTSSSRISSLQPVGACFEKDVLSDTKLRNLSAFNNIKESLDQDTAELTALKSITPSHTRRFSFSLSRLGRSFSFKEGSSLPHLTSLYIGAKSGPVTPQTSIRWDNPSKDKANGQNRIRSSPLRRLLDPLLKHKASDIHHSAESSQTQKGSINSINFTTIRVNESLDAEKSNGSLVQGLLQLTIKNGLPLFKFVLNNERKIFAATRNSLASLDKDDLGCCFTFYLVNEFKKKSGGWISHGSKEKSCGYAYNVVAQMKCSTSKIIEPINQNSKRQRLVKEYVLSGVEISQTDQGQPRFIQSRELAAVVFETPFENSSNEGLCSKECLKCLADEGCLCSSGENGVPGRTTVILPGGVHGSPNKGEPSSLIYRWKTGGSCDCGGWDIGCKLLVLSYQNQSSHVPKASKPYHDSFQLFVKEGAEQNRPLFTLSPMNDGFFSVEFDSTVTHLQAFFISVAVLSCQKVPSSLEMSSMLEETLKEPSSNNNSRLQGKTPVKYTPIPPLSPVGRV